MPMPMPTRMPSFNFMEIETEREYIPVEVWSGKRWYTCMRKNCQRAVCVMWDDKSITVEPVCSLIDTSKQEVNEKMIPILYNWKIAAETFKRTIKCAFCEEYSEMSDFMCKDCANENDWLNILINNERIIRENVYINDTSMKMYQEDNVHFAKKPDLNFVPEDFLKTCKRKYTECEVIDEMFYKLMKI